MTGETMSLEKYRELMGLDKPVSKYKAKKTVVDGITFDSAKEAKRYKELLILVRDGAVSHFLMQVPFLLEGGVKYRLDFLVFWVDGPPTYEDVKGVKTQAYKIKKKMVEARYPIKITEI